VGGVVTTAVPNLWVGGDHEMWMREVVIGAGSSDALTLDNRRIAYLAANPLIATTANNSGSFPLDQDGNILIQARQNANNGIQLAVGASSSLGLNIQATGEVQVINAAFSQVDVSLTYSASMTPNSLLGNIFEIVANNGTAFTINAPTNPRKGRKLTFVLFNVSGGALGAATWNAIYKMAAWTNPANANNRAITFYFDGSSWREINRTTVDIPN